ncbi:MAG: histidine phosphatase family protein [Povalibacter sp.]
MAGNFPQVWLVRHGETEWSRAGQHTGRSDIPLTSKGESDASALKPRLSQHTFAKIMCSPLRRARQTCELAGFGDVFETDENLLEWNYGEYEGQRTAEIRMQHPGWNAFEHGCPGGENLSDVTVRAERFIAAVRDLNADILVFAHRDILRVIAARWVNLPAMAAQRLYMDPASISILGYDHSLQEPILRTLNT